MLFLFSFLLFNMFRAVSRLANLESKQLFFVIFSGSLHETRMASIALLITALAGAVEGFYFYRSGLFFPAAVADQMLFQRFMMMKIFFSGAGFSMLTQSVLSYVDHNRFEKSRTYIAESHGFLRPMTGCLILGVGMAVAGSGPTLIPLQ